MDIKIYDLLDKNQCEELIKKLQTCDLWQDGKLTTGDRLKDRKTNNELIQGDLYQEIIGNVLGTFYGSDVGRKIHTETYFNTVCPPMINKYHVGEGYGWHFDETIMPNQDGHLTRMDYSFTVFLNDDYEGGELDIEGKRVKGKQGQIVIYDNKLRHRVTKITKGTRFACVGWLSSLIEDVEVRNRLCTNSKLLRSYENTDDEVFIELQKTHMLLLKKFS